MRKFRTKQARNRERVRLVLKALGMLLLLVALGALLTYGAHRPEFRIQNIYISTDGSLSEETLMESVQNELQGMLLGIFPKDSIVFLRRNSVEQALMTHFPRILRIDVRQVKAKSLSITIHERKPEALWCGDIVPPVAYEYTLVGEETPEEMWGSCYLLDENSYIYAKAPIYTGDVFSRYYGSLEVAEPIGQLFITKEEFDQWQALYETMREEDYAIKAILFVDERDMELYLTGALRLLVARTFDVEVTRKHIAATLTSGVLDETRTVEYLDLRFGSKAYVKYVDEQTAD